MPIRWSSSAFFVPFGLGSRLPVFRSKVNCRPIATALTDRVLSAVGGLRPLSLPVGAASVELRSLPVERVNFQGAGVAKQER